MGISGYCDADSEVSCVERVGFAKKEHICDECSEKIAVGELFSWAIFGVPGSSTQDGKGYGSSARRCQFCASFAEGFECIAYGGLREAIECADLEDIMEIPEVTLNEVLRRFGFSLKNFASRERFEQEKKQ